MKIANLLSASFTAAIVFTSSVLAYEYIDRAKEEINCLALNIYHEARGEPVDGQIAVGTVTMNRVLHTWFPNSVCEVVWQPGQFSWTNDGRSDTPREQREWNRAQLIAKEVYFGYTDHIAADALFYHATYVTPSWVNHVEPIGRIGRHQFYAWNGKW